MEVSNDDGGRKLKAVPNSYNEAAKERDSSKKR